MSGETPTLKLQLHDVAGTVLVGLCGKIYFSNLHASVEFSLLSMQLLCSLHVHDWGEPEGAPHLRVERWIFHIYTSVDAKHHGASLSKWWDVTWVGNNSICTHIKLQLSK